MQLQMTTDYAIRILTYLAVKKAVIASSELSEQLKIPQKYIYNIGRKLKTEKYVATVAGPFGGYVLIREPEEVSLYDIILTFEGTVKINRCLEGNGFCSRDGISFCAVHNFYTELQSTIEEALKAQTLSSLFAYEKERGGVRNAIQCDETKHV